MRKIIQPCGFHCIKINNLGVSFGEQTVLEDVNMHIHCGSFNVIIGQNGAGKSTLIKAILGEIPHTVRLSSRILRTDIWLSLKSAMCRSLSISRKIHRSACMTS